MSQLSKTNLEGTVQKELFDQFFWVISEFGTKDEVESFFGELLTKTERVILVKRLAIAVLLSRGYTYRNIRVVLRVSFPTIRNVQFWLEHGGQGYKKALEKINSRENLTSFLQKVDRLVDLVNQPIIAYKR